MGEEMATDTNDLEKTKFRQFCQRKGINPNLIMLKITLFVMYGATSSLLPYLTIHMQSIGLTVEEIAIIYLALPFTTFLSPPITGFLVDKFGKYKPVVIMSLLLNALFHHSLLMIPQQEIPGVVPSAYVMQHPTTNNVEIWYSPCPSRECPEEEMMQFTVDQCLPHCLLLEQNPKIEIAPSAQRVIINSKPSTQTNSKSSRAHEVLTSTTMIPLQLNESLVTTLNTNASTIESWVLAAYGESTHLVVDMHPDLAAPIEQLGMEIEKDDNETVTDFVSRFGRELLWKHGINVTELEETDLRCGGLVVRHNMSDNYKLSEGVKECMVQRCRFTENGPEICPPDYKEGDENVFWMYFLLRFLATTMLSAGVTIMDPIALTMIEKYGGDFGRERLFSSIGMAIFSPITGIMIDYSSRGLGYTDYSAAFYTYDVLLIISTLSVLFMPLGEKLPADNVFKDLWNLLKMPHVIAFIIFLFILGNFWGFIESFLFLYLKELGAPNYLLGITITVGTLSSVPFLYGADRITKIFGHVNLIIIAFFSHAGRLVGYSFIENAWWCFPFEAMEALSCHLMWVAAATYCSILAPKHLLATLIGVLGMAHFSLGRGSGSFTGGLLIGHVGTRDAFRYMGLLAVVGGIVYGLLHLVWLRKFDSSGEEEEQETVEKGESNEKDKFIESNTKDQGTSMSLERLSLMIKYNQIGSLSSLPRGSRVDIHDQLSHRRSSYQLPKHHVTGGSASKVDISSALEINHKASNNSVLSSRVDRTSNQSLGRHRADSAPKLSHGNMKNISQPALEGVVVEDEERRESIPEESEHQQQQRTLNEQSKPIKEDENQQQEQQKQSQQQQQQTVVVNSTKDAADET